MAGTLALVAFALTFVIALWNRAPAERWWSAIPIALGAVTMIFGGSAPEVHRLISLVTIGVALRNCWAFSGIMRWSQLIGAGAWFLALAYAHMLFGGV